MADRLVVVDPDFETQREQVEEHLFKPMVELTRSGRGHQVFQEGLMSFQTVSTLLAAA